MQTTPVAILVRVSTSLQNSDRQKSELLAYAETKGFKVVEVVEETISGRASANDRTGLKRVVELVESGSVKKVLVHEVSRIARTNSPASEKDFGSAAGGFGGLIKGFPQFHESHKSHKGFNRVSSNDLAFVP